MIGVERRAFALLLCSVLNGAARASDAVSAPAHARSTLIMTVDPRMELLGAVQQLARGRLDPAFKPDPEIEARFGRLRGHPAVLDYAETYRKLGNQESYGLIATFLTPPPELKWARDPRGLSSEFFARVGGRASVERFLAELRDFARDSDFAGYVEGRRAEYARAERDARAALGDYDYLGAIDAYMGRGIGSRMTVFLCVSYDVSGLDYMTPYPYGGPHRKNAGPYEIFVALRPRPRGLSPGFDLDDPFDDGLLNEYFFAFTDSIRVDEEDAIGAYAPLHPSFRGECFADWQHCAGQLIVTALADRLSARLRAERRARESAFAGARRRFTDLFERAPREPRPPSPVRDAENRLSRRLEEYEAHRDLYPTLAEFYPRLIDAFGPPPASVPAR